MMASKVLEKLHLPFPRENVLTLPPVIAELRKDAPIVPVITQTGDPAWFVIAFDEAKTAFSDRRFGYYTHEDPKNASRMAIDPNQLTIDDSRLGGGVEDVPLIW